MNSGNGVRQEQHRRDEERGQNGGREVYPPDTKAAVHQARPRSLVEKIRWSLERDRSLPLWFKVRKAVVYV
ncbi:MAG: hypothetical protein ACRDGA_09630, partial [Bacteroidota bacterium]